MNGRNAIAALALALAACSGPLLVWHGRSPDRSTHARLIEVGGQQRMIVGEAEGPRVDAVGLGQLRWCTRGLVYPARVGERWRVMVGDRAEGEHDAIGEIVAEGERVAYAALDGERWRVVVDGEPGPSFNSLRSGTLRFFREGRRLVYVGRDESGEHVVVDGVVGRGFEQIGLVRIGAKGARLAYVGWEGERASVVVEDRVESSHDDVVALELAAQEPRYAALVVDGGAPALVHDRSVIARPANAERLTISADGAHVAWVTRDEGREHVWIDGTERSAHDEIERAVFVPRTGALVYVARDGERRRVVHQGEPGPHAERVDALVVSDAGHWGYVARRGAGRFVVIDGELRFRGEWAGALALAERGDGWAFVTRTAGRRFVVTPRGRVAIGRPFVDTLVLDPAGEHWAIAIADRRARRVEVLVDGRSVAPIDLDEVAAAITQAREPVDAVRAIVAGELARAR